MSTITEAINRLIISSEGDFSSRIGVIDKDCIIDETKTIAHFFYIKLDGSGNVRKDDFLNFVTDRIVDYSLPEKEKNEAKEHMARTGSMSKCLELQRKASALFTDLEKTGELGEIMLYILSMEILRLPQLISKISLKTSGRLHYQGADAIHFNYNQDTQMLEIYWGESKMEKTITSALNNCFESISPILTSTISDDSPQSRDIQLVITHLPNNINNKELEDFLVEYLDLNSEKSNKLDFRGVCFIGFDSKEYPQNPKEKIDSELFSELQKRIDGWKKSIKTQIGKHTSLDKFDINVFLMPFDSVDDMRTDFLKKLKKK